MSRIDGPADGLADVTVVIPAYNAEDRIAKAIQSANAVTANILVIDDGSTDRTGEIASSEGAMVLTQPNRGAAFARKLGLANVATEFVIFLDSDDELRDGARDALLSIKGDSSVAVVGGQYELLPRRGGRIAVGPAVQHEYSTADLVSSLASPWPPCAAVWRTEAVRASFVLEPAPLNPRFAEDYEMLIRASQAGRIIGRNVLAAGYTPFGGKSTVAALEALEAAETIRRYYAKHGGITIRQSSTEQLRRRSVWRLFRAHGVEFGIPSAIINALQTPGSFPRVVSYIGIQAWHRMLRIGRIT